MNWKEVTDFVLKHLPVSETWEEGVLENWIVWAAGKDFLFACYDVPGENRKLTGLAIVRPVLEVDEFQEADDRYDMNGPILYCDLCIAFSKNVMKALGCGVLARFGYRKSFSFKRFERASGVKTYDANKFRKTLLGS